MGKKDRINLLPKFEDTYQRIINLDKKEFEELKKKYCKRSINHYNLRWYWSALENWACIDNSHGERNFRFFVTFDDFKDQQRSSYFEQVAVILASELKMEQDFVS